MEWYTIADIDQIDSPALVVYPERVRENIALAKKMLGESGDTVASRLRPHVKTHKSPEITRLFLEAGIKKFKCATIAEAEMLAISGAGDVLLAYQPVGPKWQRLISLIQKYPETKFSGLIDDPRAATAMDHAFSANHLHIPVYIDLNLGMNRTGIEPGKPALDLYRNFSGGKGGIYPVGLHAYDGHIRDADPDQRKQKCDEAFDRVTRLRDALMEQGLNEPVIVAGGSPTFSIHCKRPGIECSPGTFVYWDKGYQDLCPEQPFKTAALVITRVISLPDATKICLDLGHKSVAAENELSRRVTFLNAPELTMVSQSEEHLVAEAGKAHRFQTGDVLYGLPFHICPTVSQYEKVLTIEKGRFTGEWKNLARDRRISV